MGGPNWVSPIAYTHLIYRWLGATNQTPHEQTNARIDGAHVYQRSVMKFIGLEPIPGGGPGIGPRLRQEAKSGHSKVTHCDVDYV